ncbi:phage tail tape measure protein [Clostridium botulinum]|uniref:Tail tape measure protein n=1 Tax=Clostridium botulinum (strain Eklund 17B / Type B) TaxID=935198 RepID=B2TQU2_CLOBB|nr:tail tape measure protein [Clostridium botulinum B str. Eklund 17B (NRP)]MBY6975769.1 phage tail tape measure protein [Clostridium botulinum]MBY7000192.1 phage tail tape measure protein [Clostridium botulinum]MCR1272950.1 phage tail tape measure protein [Clostridium botulinum]NFD71468.1 phage tail tape measure protein [Clostridium botulinum]
MASNIKGITVEIGGDTTKLDKALKGVNTSSRSLQGELKKVNVALKLDPTNVTLIKQKQDILRESVEKTKEKLETLKSTQAQVQAQFEKGEIGVEQYRAFEREIENTEQKLKGLEIESKNFGTNVSPSFIAAKEHLASFGEKATQTGKSLLPLTVGIAAIGAGTVKFASDFQSGMSQVAATMGYTTDQLHDSSSQEAQDFERLKDAAKDMGATTQFSATEASEALNYLALAGYDVDKSISTLPNVLNLAAAGGMELGTACDMVTDAASALNLTTDQTTVLVDQMAKTSQKSNTSVSQLGEAILTVGGTANTLKGGVTEMNTALGELANVGIKGAEGGTHLRNVILSLSAPTDTAAGVLKQLGVECLDADGNMRALPDILKDINAGLSEAGSGEKAQVISKIFNKTDIAAVQGLLSGVTGSTLDLKDALASVNYNVEEHGRTLNDMKNAYDETLPLQDNVNSMMSMFEMDADQAAVACTNLAASVNDGTDSWSNLYDQIGNAGGAASEQAKTMLDNLKGKATLLQSALEGLGIQIGDIILPWIEAFTNKINGLVTWLSNLSPTVQKVIVVIASLVAALGPVLIIIGKMATGISALMGAAIKIKEFATTIQLVSKASSLGSSAMSLLGTAIGFILSPVGLVVIAIAGLVAAFVYFWNTSDSFREFWINLWDTICSACSSAIDSIVSFFTDTLPSAFNTVIDFIKNNWEGLALLLVNPFAGAFKLIYDNCEGFRNTIDGFINSLIEGIKNAFNGIKEFFSNLWDGIKEIFSTVFNFIIEIITEWGQNITANFSGTIDGITQIFSGWGEVINGVWEVIKNIFMGAILIICDLVTGDFTQLGTDLSGIWDNISSALSNIWDGISNIAQGVWNTICSFISEFCASLINGLQIVWQDFSTFISSLWTGIQNLASSIWNGICSTISSVCTTIATTATNIWNGIVTTITGVMNIILSTVSSIWNNVSSTISSIISNFPSMASTAFNNMCSAIGNALSGLGSIISSGFSSGISFIKSLPGEAITWGKDFIQGLVNGIKNAASAVGDAVKGIAQDIRSYLHFSVPDVGPLTDYESWMPDFMEGLSKGIEKTKSKVVNSIKGLTTDMQINLNSNAYTPSFETSSNSNNSTNGSPKRELILNIENFNNNRNTDVKQLMQEAEFYRKTH